VPDTLSPSQLSADVVKRVSWDISRATTRLAVTKTRVGLVEMALNVLRRRPAEFPTLRFAAFRREILGQARRGGPFEPVDVAVIRLRAALLGSPLDSRYTAPIDGADVDAFALNALGALEETHGATADQGTRQRAFDAAWKQFGEFVGAPARTREAHLAASEDYLPADATGLAARLREIEAEHIAAFSAHSPFRG
jgi:hypothetical protein